MADTDITEARQTKLTFVHAMITVQLGHKNTRLRKISLTRVYQEYKLGIIQT